MVTLLPALLVIFGRWIFWPFRPHFGSAEPTAVGLLGSRSATASAVRPRDGLDRSPPSLLAVACLGLFRLDTERPADRGQYFTETLDSVTAQKLLVDHGLVDSSSTPIQVVANADQLTEVEESMAGIDGLGTATDPTSIGDGRSYFEVADQVATCASERGLRHRRGRPRRRCTRSTVRTPWSAVGAAFYLDTKTASRRDNKVVIPTRAAGRAADPGRCCCGHSRLR